MAPLGEIGKTPTNAAKMGVPSGRAQAIREKLKRARCRLTGDQELWKAGCGVVAHIVHIAREAAERTLDKYGEAVTIARFGHGDHMRRMT